LIPFLVAGLWFLVFGFWFGGCEASGFGLHPMADFFTPLF
jgi:hypothetical protein